MGFPERLKRLRTERKLGFDELADMVGVHSTQLRRYEKGEAQPTLEVLRNLCVALNVSGDELLFDEDERSLPDDFVVQLESLKQLSEEDRKSLRSIVDGLLLRQQAKKVVGKG